jgi:hypothetical protein
VIKVTLVYLDRMDRMAKRENQEMQQQLKEKKESLALHYKVIPDHPGNKEIKVSQGVGGQAGRQAINRNCCKLKMQHSSCILADITSPAF